MQDAGDTLEQSLHTVKFESRVSTFFACPPLPEVLIWSSVWSKLSVLPLPAPEETMTKTAFYMTEA